MLIYPAIDLYEGKAVRLFKGDYGKMTVYSENPVSVAADFVSAGVSAIHLVDLEGARTGIPSNLRTVLEIRDRTGLFCEFGGGVRSMDTVRLLFKEGVDRVILGTAAAENPSFLEKAVSEFGDRIAVGIDLKDGRVAVRGWTESAGNSADAFFAKICLTGVRTVIVTDISRDGTLEGANLALYRKLIKDYPLEIIASGGVSSLEDLIALKDCGVAGAIVGKAYYEGKIILKEAVKACL
ncbi:MAG: 1-(5-phosphoribosyl)-5-[Clostridia bacterium]|nr:1-(5-phosphoribosyl)-5-[(5-phosphoribosylamino)methylideneamino]imidazole-4-carboxamide isomerase [Clostridia bacterium]